MIDTYGALSYNSKSNDCDTHNENHDNSMHSFSHTTSTCYVYWQLTISTPSPPIKSFPIKSP